MIATNQRPDVASKRILGSLRFEPVSPKKLTRSKVLRSAPAFVQMRPSRFTTSKIWLALTPAWVSGGIQPPLPERRRPTSPPGAGVTVVAEPVANTVGPGGGAPWDWAKLRLVRLRVSRSGALRGSARSTGEGGPTSGRSWTVTTAPGEMTESSP